MAEEIRVTPDGVSADDPEVARAEIAMTRARMSETIDEIEDALLRRKEKIQDRLDVFSPVRERPFQAAGAVFGVGLVLGLLTGGDDDDEDDDYEIAFDFDSELESELDLDGRLGAEARARKWESRSRRLLRLAREERAAHRAHHDDEWDDHDDEDDPAGPFAGLRDTIADRVGPAVFALARELTSAGTAARSAG
jgi:ElaB/YqjD/DUF883 family membrane-anchored ribosome-binding protein